ncbi:Zn-dependent hydrolase [Mycolicibacterium duvalii]|uniref:Zn-dependent hydrolase n=1 Tax=Mycolicibacterium duvalii TaxID=39688 RepID=A0A7I7JXS3_9MYCO|nr:Zn-dependent hydrolase [Mycolicibacterium duvalii]MCV7366830.1 Zn-dependent hydrolase [Mycolicibacterium duvalii]BBX16707.1 Zn-dependent hydrolase [Mycolicibacterium duvalii]
MTSSGCDLAVAAEHVVDRLDALAAIGADPAGGVTRLAYSPEDVHARETVARWMAEAGLQVWIDQATNLFGRLPGSDPGAGALLSGSHLDSVTRAGALDGPAGVVAALAVAQALCASGTTLRHDLVVVAFSNEEGTRGTPGMVGSKAMAGLLTPEDLARPGDGAVTLAERIRSAGGDPQRIADARWSPDRIAGFIELHIEQGPVLHSEGARIGVVTEVTGQLSVAVTITGEANHAGSTPMNHRRDAAVAAARVVLAVERLATDGHVRVATTGVLGLRTGARNVVAGEALLGVDIRDGRAERIADAYARLDREVTDIARRTRTLITLTPGTCQSPVATDRRLTEHIIDAADELEVPWLELPSGAGHDAQVMSAIAPMAMVFVPSVGGVSHSPDEATDPSDLVLGANVLLRALVAADAQLP